MREQVNNFVKTVGSLKSGDLQPVLDLEVARDGVPLHRQKG